MQLIRVNSIDMGIQYINTAHIQRFYQTNDIISIEFISGQSIQITDMSIDQLIEKIVYK
jgi:hypothetical protein